MYEAPSCCVLVVAVYFKEYLPSGLMGLDEKQNDRIPCLLPLFSFFICKFNTLAGVTLSTAKLAQHVLTFPTLTKPFVLSESQVSIQALFFSLNLGIPRLFF